MFLVVETAYPANEPFRGRSLAKDILVKSITNISPEAQKIIILNKILFAINNAKQQIAQPHRNFFGVGIANFTTQSGLTGLFGMLQIQNQNPHTDIESAKSIAKAWNNKQKEFVAGYQPAVISTSPPKITKEKSSPQEMVDQVKNILQGINLPAELSSKNFFKESAIKKIIRKKAKENALKNIRDFLTKKEEWPSTPEQMKKQLTELISKLYAACLFNNSKKLTARIETTLKDYLDANQWNAELKALQSGSPKSSLRSNRKQ